MSCDAKIPLTCSTFILLLLAGLISNPLLADVKPTAVSLRGGQQGIGFDDLAFAFSLGKVLVPGGQTGKIYIIDPATSQVTSIDGLSVRNSYAGGHGEGTTSADAGQGLIFAIDRTKRTVNIIDPSVGKIVDLAALSADPDYVRFVEKTNELWVTEPDAERIEIFSIKPLKSVASISIPGGPESLVIDRARPRAYTHLWSGTTLAIDIKTRTAVAQWPNGCQGSRGIAIDEERGFLFAGCAEGKAVVLDLNGGGRQLSHLESGAGVDVIGYNSKLKHLYLPGAKSATMAILDVSKEGKLVLLDVVKTEAGAHCAVGDDRNNIWVCDPQHGRLLQYLDGFSVHP